MVSIGADGAIATMELRVHANDRVPQSARLEKGFREQTRFFFLTWSVLLAAIIGLYART